MLSLEHFFTWVYSTTILPGLGKVVSVVDTAHWDGALQSAITIRSTRTWASIAYAVPQALVVMFFMFVFGFQGLFLSFLIIVLTSIHGRWRRYPVDIVINSTNYTGEGEPISFDTWVDDNMKLFVPGIVKEKKVTPEQARIALFLSLFNSEEAKRIIDAKDKRLSDTDYDSPGPATWRSYALGLGSSSANNVLATSDMEHYARYLRLFFSAVGIDDKEYRVIRGTVHAPLVSDRAKFRWHAAGVYQEGGQLLPRGHNLACPEEYADMADNASCRVPYTDITDKSAFNLDKTKWQHEWMGGSEPMLFIVNGPMTDIQPLVKNRHAVIIGSAFDYNASDSMLHQEESILIDPMAAVQVAKDATLSIFLTKDVAEKLYCFGGTSFTKGGEDDTDIQEPVVETFTRTWGHVDPVTHSVLSAMYHEVPPKTDIWFPRLQSAVLGLNPIGILLQDFNWGVYFPLITGIFSLLCTTLDQAWAFACIYIACIASLLHLSFLHLPIARAKVTDRTSDISTSFERVDKIGTFNQELFIKGAIDIQKSNSRRTDCAQPDSLYTFDPSISVEQAFDLRCVIGPILERLWKK